VFARRAGGIGVRMASIARRREAAALASGNSAYLERRDDIIRAAAAVFKKNGYPGAKISDIAAAMGIDRATLYYYFSSKEEIFHYAVGDAVERNCLRAEKVAKGPGTAAGKLRTLVTELMSSYADSYPYLYIYIQQDLAQLANRSSPWAQAMGRFNKRYERALVAVVEQGAQDGTLRVDTEPWVIAYGVLGMLAWSNRWFDPGKSPVPAREIGAAYADMILRGLER
jgi:TetR/AcrR family transcriptional regulator, cholesterol catabolism regulator